MNDKISADVCEKEFDRMCAARRIVSDTTAMTAVEKAVFEARKRLLLRVMTRGELIVNADGDPQFTPPGGKPLVFHRATGATLMAQDGFGSNEDVARLAAVATVMTKSTPGELSKLDLEDFRIVSDITNFFLTRS